MKYLDKHIIAEKNCPHNFKDDFNKNIIRIDGNIRPLYFRRIHDVIEEIKPHYYIDKNGLIWSEHSGKLLSSRIHKTGYVTISLLCYNKENTVSYRLHRLIKLLFDYRADHANLEINHKDGFKNNNNYYNLEWVTSRENIRHAIKHNLMYENKNTLDGIDVVKEICENLQKGARPKKLAEKLDVSYDSVKDIKNNKSYLDISSQYDLDVKMHPAQRLYIEEVQEIYDKLKKKLNDGCNISYREIGEPYGVTRDIVRRIRDWYIEKGDL
jgi:hypothetical protein